MKHVFLTFWTIPPPSRFHAPQQRGESGWAFMYSTYIWFYFMEQEIGPEAIAEIWEEFGRARAWHRGAGDSHHRCPTPLRRRTSASSPCATSTSAEARRSDRPDYEDLDAQFPVGDLSPHCSWAGRMTRLAAAHREDEEPRRFPDRLRSLTAHYYRFLPDPHGGMLALDFSGLAPAADLDVDVSSRSREGRGSGGG